MPQTYQCQCGCDQWVEEKVIRLAGKPSASPQLRSAARETIYRLKCARCNRVAPATGAPLAIPSLKSNTSKRKSSNGTKEN
jgi:hypothetical protein